MLSCNRAFLNPLLKRPYYPVGDDIQVAKNTAREMAEGIKAAFPTENICLVGRGSSGLILSSLISMFIPVLQIINIKKDGESSHDTQAAYNETYTYIVVDDFLSTGATLQAIFDFWNKRCKNTSGKVIPIKAICVGDEICRDNTRFLYPDIHVDTLICREIDKESIKCKKIYKFSIDTDIDAKETSIGTFKLESEPKRKKKAKSIQEILGIE